ncbi:hypothetical protein R6Q59_023275 [Mikania micrantha]
MATTKGGAAAVDSDWKAAAGGESGRRSYGVGVRRTRITYGRRDRLLGMEMGQQKAIDYDLLMQLGELQRMVAIIGEDMPWSLLFDSTYAPQYRLITVEFLSTFVYRPQAPDFQP